MNKSESVQTLQFSSLEELEQALPELKKRGRSRYVAIAVNNPEIKVCPFEFNQANPKEVRNLLAAEAVELLSLPASEIDLEHLIFETEANKVRGVFVCFPKKLQQDYLDAIDRAGFIPVKIVPYILAGIDSFLGAKKDEQGRSCLIDFTGKNRIYFAVFSRGQCDFLREIHYEEAQEIEHEVIQSLRCACSVSTVKRFDHVYVSGRVPERQKEELVKRIKLLFCGQVSEGNFTDVEASLKSRDNLFALNIIKKRSLSLPERGTAAKVQLAAGLACLMIVAALGARIFLTRARIARLETNSSELDYNYARDLKSRLEAVSHEQ